MKNFDEIVLLAAFKPLGSFNEEMSILIYNMVSSSHFNFIIIICYQNCICLTYLLFVSLYILKKRDKFLNLAK